MVSQSQQRLDKDVESSDDDGTKVSTTAALTDLCNEMPPATIELVEVSINLPVAIASPEPGKPDATTALAHYSSGQNAANGPIRSCRFLPEGW